jgi:hypothetical protein
LFEFTILVASFKHTINDIFQARVNLDFFLLVLDLLDALRNVGVNALGNKSLGVFRTVSDVKTLSSTKSVSERIIQSFEVIADL